MLSYALRARLNNISVAIIAYMHCCKERGDSAAESRVMLALIMSLLAGRTYRWQPELDVSDSFVLSTLFADGGH